MNTANLTKAIAALLLGLSASASAEIQPEVIGKIETLPERYPDHWMLVHDVSFFHMFEGEVLVVDPLAATGAEQYKGMMTASFIASYLQSATRNEHYVAETFYSRGGRGGERTDVVTVWDSTNLSVLDEIEIPAKRISGMPKTLAAGLTPDERFLLIYNFTPAQSVTVVDLEARKFVAEAATPGCGFAIPTGQRSFTSICANSTFRTTHLSDDGTVKGSETSDVAFDGENDPIFEGAAFAGGTAFFPTFQGGVLPVDVSGEEIAIGERWWLTDESERNWRPGGLRPVVTDSAELGYFLMNPAGGEGTHKDPGSEVWIYDLAAGKRLGRIELATPGLAIGTSGSGDGRLLAVTNINMQIDIYRIPEGEFVHTLAIEPQTPFMVYGAR